MKLESKDSAPIEMKRNSTEELLLESAWVTNDSSWLHSIAFLNECCLVDVLECCSNKLVTRAVRGRLLVTSLPLAFLAISAERC